MGAFNSNTQDYDEKYLAFVSNIHHDLMGPLTFIKGYSDLLLTEDYGPLQESQREFVQRINRFVMRANKSLELYQKLATIESGILLVKQEPVDIASIINSIATHLAELESNNQTLKVNVPDNLPAVKARFHEIYQIVSGLIESSITNSLPRAEILVYSISMTNYVRTTINSSNTKPPVEDDEEGRDPFEFMELKIIQQYIEQFGGEFGEERQEGKGSTMWFTLPIADESAET